MGAERSAGGELGFSGGVLKDGSGLGLGGVEGSGMFCGGGGCVYLFRCFCFSKDGYGFTYY